MYGRRSNFDGGTIAAIMFIILWFTVVVGGLIGYVLNIISIIHTGADPITGMFLARCIGTIVFPLGAILGYF